MIKLPANTNLVKLAQAAYKLSRPVGMGMLQYKADELSEEEAKNMLYEDKQFALNMDYVHGRQVKLTVRKHPDGSLTVQDSWYDHGPWDELFAEAGIVIGGAA